VDDNLISHTDSKVVSSVINRIENEFEKMTVTTGPKHTFLGMNIEFKPNGTTEIDTIPYIREALVEFGEKLFSRPPTPAGENILKNDCSSTRLDNNRAEIFHSIAAKILWIIPRIRPDISFPISFLCSRVGCSTEEDWAKLNRLLTYLNATIHEKRILGGNNLGALSTWVDASYAIHADYKRHTGGVMSFGIGAVHCKSTKQKINTKSSTESKIVRVSEYLPYNIWMEIFLKELGYKLTSKKLHQDNKSAIRMEKNGKRHSLYFH